MNCAQIIDFLAAAQVAIPQFVDFHSTAHIAGLIIAMEPLSVRMSRMRAAEKDARRAAEREARKNVAPVVIRSPVDAAHRCTDPAERTRQCEARRAAQKHEADRAGAALAVTAAADAFMRAIRNATVRLACMEAACHDLLGVDAGGRALVIVSAADGVVSYRHERRARGLARLVNVERQAFVAAIRAHPDVTVRAAREAREAFATALRSARARDDAMVTGDGGRFAGALRFARAVDDVAGCREQIATMMAGQSR